MATHMGTIWAPEVDQTKVLTRRAIAKARADKRVQARIIRRIIIWVGVLAFADMVLTLLGIRFGVFREMNPLLELTLRGHVAWFLVLKAALTTFWAAVFLRVGFLRWGVGVHVPVIVLYAFIVLRSIWHLL